MNDALLSRVALSAFFVALYVALFWVTNALVGALVLQGLVSLLFLPAFVRLISFLVLGFWAMPLLFFAGYLCILLGFYDIAPGNNVEIAATIAMAIGAPVGTWIVMKLRRVRPDLNALSPLDLLWLSLGCSLGNAVVQKMALLTMLPAPPGRGIMIGLFIGDTLGTWLAIMLVKAGLTFASRFAVGRRES
ncbi:MAG: hypothetical protein ACKOXK_08710 [Chakrabartia sp.]